MSTKNSVEFFLFCLEIELFAKIKKYRVSTHSQKPLLLTTQYLNKIFKNPTGGIERYNCHDWCFVHVHVPIPKT